MATYWVPDLPNIRGISGHLFIFCKWCLICMIQQAYKYLSSSLWSCLTLFELKILHILKSSGWTLKKSELPWKQLFYSLRGVFCRTINLPSLNGLCCKLAKIALLYTWYNIGLSVWHHQSSHLHIFHLFQT